MAELKKNRKEQGERLACTTCSLMLCSIMLKLDAEAWCCVAWCCVAWCWNMAPMPIVFALFAFLCLLYLRVAWCWNMAHMPIVFALSAFFSFFFLPNYGVWVETLCIWLPNQGMLVVCLFWLYNVSEHAGACEWSILSILATAYSFSNCG